MKRLASLILLMTLALPAQAESSKAVSVPAGDLTSGLELLTKQLGVELIYHSDQLKGQKTKGVKGRLSPKEAVTKLLEGTRFVLQTDSSGAMVVSPATAGVDAGTAQGQMRLAAGAAVATVNTSGVEADGQLITVQDKRIKSDANTDARRTIEDAQPYQIFDAKTIEQSGAVDIGEFLKKHLVMNTVGETWSETGGLNTVGAMSKVDLLGLGADSTLILVNGRQLSGAVIISTNMQPDLNGIAMNEIERIEVLPTSASGIYGANAVGGVVNVILKRDYTGGGVRLGYDNSADGDSVRRSASANYGLALEGGRTRLRFSGSWSQSEPLMFKDRAWIFQKYLADIETRVNVTSTASSPWLGAVPNIVKSGSGNLILKPEYGGRVLGSRITHVPIGTSPDVTTAELAALLAANAGTFNLDFPVGSSQVATGLKRTFGATPERQSLRVGLSRELLSWLRLEADFSVSDNNSRTVHHPLSGVLTLPAAAPSNPFTTALIVKVPDGSQTHVTTASQQRRAELSLEAQLPWKWRGALDYTWSENRFEYSYMQMDQTARTAALLSGELDPLVDSIQYPIGIEKYSSPLEFKSGNLVRQTVLRLDGPLPALPWGQPDLRVNLSNSRGKTPERTQHTIWELTPLNNSIFIYYPRENEANAIAAEMNLPLVKRAWFPGLHSLDLQLASRRDSYRRTTGTPYRSTRYNLDPPTFSYGSPRTADGLPYFAEASSSQGSFTVGLRYQPVRDVTLRVSRGTAYLPPTPEQLLRDHEQSAEADLDVYDPQTQQTVPVFTIGGGNPDLRPQNSKSLNAGIIFSPTWKPLEGLRLNAEYYRIRQYDAIGSLPLQTIVDRYPGRVTRDDDGMITLVDTSLLNLYGRDNAGWTLSVNYAAETERGRFNLSASRAGILHMKRQESLGMPELDAVNFPSEGGAPKYKSTATLNWSAGPLSVGWTASHISAYKQYAAEGGPLWQLRALTNTVPTSTDRVTITQQGSETIPSQMYHDLFVSYHWDGLPGAGAGTAGRLFDGMSLLFGLRNIFDTPPPMDARRGNTGAYMSAYGDARLRSYYLNASFEF